MIVGSVLFGVTGLLWLLTDGFFLAQMIFAWTDVVPHLDVGKFLWRHSNGIITTLAASVGLCVAAGLVLAGREAGRLVGVLLSGMMLFQAKDAIVAYLRRWPEPEYGVNSTDLSWLWLWHLDAARWVVLIAVVLAAVVAVSLRTSATWFHERRQARGRTPSAMS